MKYMRRKESVFLIAVILLSCATVFLAGCKKSKNENGSRPVVVIPDTISTSKIDTLLRIFARPSPADTVKDTLGMKKILGNYIVSGVVSANDESGNLYKTIYIQNATAGIVIDIDITNLITVLPVGKKIYVKCKGLYLGQYGGVTTLGMIYNGAIGRIAASELSSHLIFDSIPLNEPKADTLDVTNLASFESHISRLVVITDMTFPEAGQPFTSNGLPTTRIIADKQGNPIMLNGLNLVLYTSSYSTFANNFLPGGLGKIRGILSYYNGQYEFILRDLKDLLKFDSTGFALTIYENDFNSNPSDWVKYSVSGNGFTWDATYTVMMANGYNGSAPSDAYLISPGINLAGIQESVLSFSTYTKYIDSGIANPFEVMLSTNYSGSGDPAVATWTTVNCILPDANSSIWTSSGNISLAAYNQKVYILFHYKSSGTSGTSASIWEVDSFKVMGKY